MGHRVKGYRRNAIYGTTTRRRDLVGIGVKGEVNPPGIDGWCNSGASRSEKGYGQNAGRVQELCARVEEIIKSEGYETNGRGVKGDSTYGYVVYGEYLRVVIFPTADDVGYPAVLKGYVKGHKKQESKTILSSIARLSSELTMVCKFSALQELNRLETKRERRVRMFEARTGRKVRRERSQRSEVRKSMGRTRERGVYRRGRARIERTHREKVRRHSLSYKATEGESTDEVQLQKEFLLAYLAQKNVKRKRSTGVVCTEAMAVVVVRSGLLRMETRRVKRRIRKREGAGREHMRARRSMERRRKAHARKSRNGRLYGYGGQNRGEKISAIPTPVQHSGGYYGYRVTVTGTLNGSRRTKRWEKGIGTVPSSSKASRRGTAEGVAKTTVGTRGVQVAYCYGLG